MIRKLRIEHSKGDTPAYLWNPPPFSRTNDPEMGISGQSNSGPAEVGGSRAQARDPAAAGTGTNDCVCLSHRLESRFLVFC